MVQIEPLAHSEFDQSKVDRVRDVILDLQFTPAEAIMIISMIEKRIRFSIDWDTLKLPESLAAVSKQDLTDFAYKIARFDARRILQELYG